MIVASYITKGKKKFTSDICFHYPYTHTSILHRDIIELHRARPVCDVCFICLSYCLQLTKMYFWNLRKFERLKSFSGILLSCIFNTHAITLQAAAGDCAFMSSLYEPFSAAFILSTVVLEGNLSSAL